MSASTEKTTNAPAIKDQLVDMVNIEVDGVAMEAPKNSMIIEATDRAGIAQFRDFLIQLGEIGSRAAADGWSLEQTIASEELTTDAGYEPIRFIISLGLDREFVLQRTWEEATGNFTVQN